MGDSVISIGELWAPSSPPGAAPAIEVVEGGPSPVDTNGVEALGGFSMKLGSLPSTTGSTTAKGVAWTGGVGLPCLRLFFSVLTNPSQDL